MAISYPSDSLLPDGILEVQKFSEYLYRGYFSPPLQALPSQEKNVERYRRCVIEVDLSAKSINVVPFIVWSLTPMCNRYSKLTEISFDLPWYGEGSQEKDLDLNDILSSAIPEIFIQNINYGFGFKKRYTQIATILEQLEVKKLFISAKEKTSIDVSKHIATINEHDLDRFGQIADNIVRRSQVLTSRLKRDAIKDALSATLDTGRLYSNDAGKISKEEFTKLVGRTNRFVEGGATLTEQKEAITIILKNAKKITEQQPKELIKLKNDIDLVNLEQLIQKFEKMLGKKLNESKWQYLFQQNPFIINMAFGVPVVNVQGQAYVGGHRLSGGGGKIADFLVKNSLTNNAVIVEIKKPSMSLIQPKAYRGGVHGPSKELSAAVSQVLDQVYLLQKDINSIKVNSNLFNIESYHIQGILIAGNTPKSANEQKSFEYFRGNSKNVQVITFEELLEKLKSLHQFLLPVAAQAKSPVNDEENNLPF